MSKTAREVIFSNTFVWSNVFCQLVPSSSLLLLPLPTMKKQKGCKKKKHEVVKDKEIEKSGLTQKTAVTVRGHSGRGPNS